MGFLDVLSECARMPELVAEFDRLAGTNLSFRGSALDLKIDEATGRLDDDLRKFIAFVWDCVWCRLPPDAFADLNEKGGTP